jgi:hypothetical protein
MSRRKWWTRVLVNRRNSGKHLIVKHLRYHKKLKFVRYELRDCKEGKMDSLRCRRCGCKLDKGSPDDWCERCYPYDRACEEYKAERVREMELRGNPRNVRRVR